MNIIFVNLRRSKVTKEEKTIIKNEIAQTFELYGFEMSFSEFHDIFELGAEFGYRLAMIKASEILQTKEPNMIFRKQEEKVLKKIL